MFTEWIERKKRKRNCKVHFGSDSIIYIISNLPVNRGNITKQVKRALNSVEKYGFPNLKNPKFEVEFDIE